MTKAEEKKRFNRSVKICSECLKETGASDTVSVIVWLADKLERKTLLSNVQAEALAEYNNIISNLSKKVRLDSRLNADRFNS